MKNRFLILLIIGIFSFEGLFSQSINDIRKQKEKAEKEITYLNRLLKEASRNKSASTEKVNILQAKITQSRKVINSLSAEVNYLQGNITENERRITELQSEREAMLDMYAKLVYASWKKRSKSDKLMFILSASDFNQAYNRFKYFQQIQKYSDKQFKLIQQVNDSLKIRNEDLKRLVGKKNEVVRTIHMKNQEMESERMKENRYVSELQRKEKDLRKKLDKEIKNRQRLAKELNRLITEQTKKASTGKGKLTQEEKLLSDDFAKNKGRLPWPVKDGFVSEKFGVSVHSLHKYLKMSNDGIDITTSKDSKVCVVFKGVVLDVCYVPGLNYTVLVQHGNFFTVYPNLLDVKVKRGDRVATKQVLGRIGYDSEKGSVLNFQIWQNVGKVQPVKLNPELWLAK